MRGGRKGKWPVSLTIAGSDSIGGAGIQADLKSFAACGVYGVSVVTALTAQNTRGVSAIHVPPASFVAAQIDQVLSDVRVASVKTGMLFNAAIIRVVAVKMKDYRMDRLVVDPVMVAKGGDRLLKAEAQRSLLLHLFPLAFVVTPNIPEAEAISGLRIRSVGDMEVAAKAIGRTGPRAVVVKGGHLPGKPVDVLWDGRRLRALVGTRVGSVSAHGTGCTFSASLAAFLARGIDLEDACARAKSFTERAIRAGSPIGYGHPVLGHLPLRKGHR